MKGFSSDFLGTLTAYEWPGNVRELFSTLDYALTQALNEQTLFPYHLPTNVRAMVLRSAFEGSSTAGPGSADTASAVPSFNHFPQWKEFRKALIADGEKQYLNNLMAITKGDVKKAARQSDLSVPRLYELLRKHRIRNR